MIQVIFVLFLVYRQSFCTDLIRQFVNIPNEKAFTLNTTVTLSCEIEKKEGNLVAIIKKEKSMFSEDCKVFAPKKYEMTCLEKSSGDKNVMEYRFKIRNLEWTDRGTWECLYAQNKRTTKIDVNVPAVFDRLTVDPVRPAVKKMENLGPGYYQQDLTPEYVLQGRGSRSNPFNLRDGTALKISCSSSCSYPEAIHLWSFANVSYGPINIEVVNKATHNICSLPNNEGMSTSKSDVTINCTTLKMVGENEIVCTSHKSNKTRVYVLCPGGEKQWELTIGEKIGLAISVVIIILLVALLYFTLKRSRTGYHSPTDLNIKV